jgi:small subunit ribosomal protein S16
MAVKIRISRLGRTHRPFFRIVVADSRCKRDGKFIEDLGTFDPIKNELICLNTGSLAAWKSKGAICTPIVNRIVKQHTK